MRLFGVVDGAGQERFGAEFDAGQRRLQFVRDVGDQFLAEVLQPQLGGVVQHQHRAAAAGGRQRPGAAWTVRLGRAVAGANSSRQGCGPFQGLSHQVEQRPPTDHFPQTPADGACVGNSNNSAARSLANRIRWSASRATTPSTMPLRMARRG